MISKTCLHCGNEYLLKPSHYDKSFYCSMTCMAEGYKTRLKGSNNPNYKGREFQYLFVCPICGKEFFSYDKTAKYCSKKCVACRPGVAERLRAQASSAGKLGGNKRKPRYCAICGIDTGLKRNKYCKDCMETKMKGVCWGRIDANQNEIVEALEGVGATVISLANVGHGVPDLVVGFRKQNFLMEIKNLATKGKLTPPQLDFFNTWRGQTAVVRTVDEALALIGAVEYKTEPFEETDPWMGDDWPPDFDGEGVS